MTQDCNNPEMTQDCIKTPEAWKEAREKLLGDFAKLEEDHKKLTEEADMDPVGVCLSCEGKQLYRKETRFPVEIKGETIEVVSEAFVCGKCGESQMNDDQMNKFIKVCSEEYKNRDVKKEENKE